MLSKGECHRNRSNGEQNIGVSIILGRDITDSSSAGGDNNEVSSNSSDKGGRQQRKRPRSDMITNTIISANDELIEEDIDNEQSQYQSPTSSFIDKNISNEVVIKRRMTDFCLDRGRIMIKEERLDPDAQTHENGNMRPEMVIGVVTEEDHKSDEQLETEKGIEKYNDSGNDMNDDNINDNTDKKGDNNDVDNNGSNGDKRINDNENDAIGIDGNNDNANVDVIDDSGGSHFDHGNGSTSDIDSSGNDYSSDKGNDSDRIIDNGQSYEGVLNDQLTCRSNGSVHDEGDSEKEQINCEGRLRDYEGDEMPSCCEEGAEERKAQTSTTGMDLEEASVELMERVLESFGDEIDIDDFDSEGEEEGERDDTTDYEDSNELRAMQLLETSESQQDIMENRSQSLHLPVTNLVDFGNDSSGSMSQDLPVGSQRVSEKFGYAEKCSASFEEEEQVILIDLSDSSHQSVSDTTTSSNETITVLLDSMDMRNDISKSDNDNAKDIHSDNDGDNNDEGNDNDSDKDVKDLKADNCNSNGNGDNTDNDNCADSGSSNNINDSNNDSGCKRNKEAESIDRECEEAQKQEESKCEEEIEGERYHSEATNNVIVPSPSLLTHEFCSKQSQLNPRKSRTTTPSGNSLSGQEEDDDGDGDGEINAKMFTRSMGIAADGDEEKGYSTVCRLPTNLEIRQGDEYQCRVQGVEEWEAVNQWSECGRSIRECASPDRDVCLWRMPDEQVIDVAEVDAYLCLAYELHETDGDEALYILQSCGYITSTALEYLKKRTSLKDIWSDEDVTLFLGAFRQHGKKFREIRRWLPHKSIAEVMNFYYDNKKRLKLSDILIERVHDEPPESNDESDSDESIEESDEETKDGRCERCGFEQKGLQKSKEHDRFLCDSCAARASVAAAVACQKRCRSVLKRVKPTKNFVPGADMLDAFSTLMKNKASASASSSSMSGQSTSHDQQSYASDRGDCEKIGYRDVFREQRRRRELEKNIIETRALCSRLMLEGQRETKLYLTNDVERHRTMVRAHYNSPSRGACRPTQYDPKWTMKESVYAVTAFKCYGKEFKQIAALIGTKTPIMVKRFYDKFRDHIDKVIQQGQEIRDDKAEWRKDRKLNGCLKAKRLKL